MLDSFSSTIEKLYAAAAAPERWGEALRAVEDVTGSAGAVIGVQPKAGGQGLVLSGRFDAELCEEFARDMAPSCPRTAFAALRPDLPFHCDALLMSEPEMDRDPVYAWFEQRAGVRYYLGTAFPDVRGYRVNGSLQRTRAQGHAQQADIELFGRLKPHLTQALHLADIIGTLTAHRALALHMLGALPHGAVIIDRLGSLVYANAAAEAVFAEADGLDAVRGRLAAARASQATALRALVARATDADRRQGGWLRVSRPSGAADYILFVSPLVVETGSLGRGRPAAIVAIFDPRQRLRLQAKPLQALFGLTAREAEVACRLARGADLASAAAQMGMSGETARTHLKRLFRKTDVYRQQDLVGLIHSLNALGVSD